MDHCPHCKRSLYPQGKPCPKCGGTEYYRSGQCRTCARIRYQERRYGESITRRLREDWE